MKTFLRHRGAWAQTKPLDQFQAGQPFQHEQHGALIDRSRRDLRIAALAGLQVEFETLDLLPELFVVEGRKPLLDLFHVDERIHSAIVPDCAPQTQIIENP